MNWFVINDAAELIQFLHFVFFAEISPNYFLTYVISYVLEHLTLIFENILYIKPVYAYTRVTLKLLTPSRRFGRWEK